MKRNCLDRPRKLEGAHEKEAFCILSFFLCHRAPADAIASQNTQKYMLILGVAKVMRNHPLQGHSLGFLLFFLSLGFVLSGNGSLICYKWTVGRWPISGDILTFLITLRGQQPYWEDGLSRPRALAAASCVNLLNNLIGSILSFCQKGLAIFPIHFELAPLSCYFSL